MTLDDHDPPSDDDKPNDGDDPELYRRLVGRRKFEPRDEDLEGANDEALAIKLATLEEEHRDLDAAIRALEESAPYERLAIARLKKKKLRLKDHIQELKDAMLPDIIA